MNRKFLLIPRAVRAAALALAMVSGGALAAIGAHGPNGEHLDALVQQGSASAVPKLQAKSELFELVATLGGGELSILIDRYDTNEPVLGATVEVESGALKAAAKFQGDHGDYAVDDPALLQALAQPGEHALVFTVAAGPQADLLDGTLHTAAAHAVDADHDHEALLTPRNAVIGGVLLLLGAAAAFILVRRRRARQGALK